jgi:hypothetical protein
MIIKALGLQSSVHGIRFPIDNVENAQAMISVVRMFIGRHINFETVRKLTELWIGYVLTVF